MTAVAVVTSVKNDALMIPQEALFTRGDRQFVYVDRGGTAEVRQVVLGHRDGGRVEAVSGIQAGERIVVAGAQKVVPEAKLVEAAAPAAGETQPE